MAKLTATVIIKDGSGREIGRTYADESAQFTDARTGTIKHDFLFHFSVEESKGASNGRKDI